MTSLYALRPKVAVVILTYNEEVHLARAVQSVSSFATSIHVIDSGSTDDTITIANSFGAEVLVRPFKNQADQFRWALERISTDAEWIMRLDADEYIEPPLADRINGELSSLSSDVVGINVDRKHIFLGKWIRYGGRYPLTLLRLFRRGFGFVEQRWMDEHIFVRGGKIAHFGGGLVDHNLNDLSYYIDKHNRYATREAVQVLLQELHLSTDERLRAGHISRQASLKRFLKDKAFNKMPFQIASLWYFLFRYIVLFGFLDGSAGLTYHFLHAFWYRYLVGAKAAEFRLALEKKPSSEEKLEELARLSGLNLKEPMDLLGVPSPK